MFCQICPGATGCPLLFLHGVTPNGHTENAGQLMDTILHPLPAMLKRAPRQPILPAQERPAHTARNAVKGSGRTGRDQN